jgi:hypothetical protein
MGGVKTNLLMLCLIAHCSGGVAQSQDPHAAQPERPTVATHAGTVAPGWLEVEASGEFDRYADNAHAVVVPVNLKIGLGSHTQLSLFPSGIRTPAGRTMELGDLSLGVKWRIADDLSFLGRVALLPIIKLPTGSTSSGAGTGTVDGTIVLISSNDLNGVALDINVAYTRRSGDGRTAPREAALWTISFGGPGIGDLGWAAELYGYPGTSGSAGTSRTVAILFGPTFTFRSWIVFDLGLIEPVVGPQPHALYCGLTWNIGRICPWESKRASPSST